jgi:hypothetical protein
LPRISTAAAAPVKAAGWPLIYIGVALTTVGTLLLELALTRIFSVIFYYHFAFLAISIAMFGLGAGGVYSYALAKRPGGVFRRVAWLAGANSAATVASLAYLLTRQGDPGAFTLGAVYVASALPFFFAGAILSLVIAETIERVERVYFFDLIGAAAGCLMLVPLLNTFGGPNTVIIVAMIFAASAAVWFSLAKIPAGRAAGVALGLALMALLVANARWPFLDVRFAKGQTLRDERFVKWNSFSRIALTPEPGTGRMAIVIDADAATGIPEFDLDRLTEKDREELLYQGPGLPYVLRPGAKTLIIGPGGGWDVARALASGAKDVTGVEINPIIADTIMRGRFADLSKRLYFRPEVRIRVEDGRSAIRRSGERYQVIQATLVDTWASTAAGAFALSENNLYTVEAFTDYFEHLTGDGLLVFTRWGFDPPRESLRLVSLAREALLRLGETDIARHTVVARQGSVEGWGAQDTVIFSRKPLDDEEVRRANEAIVRAGMESVYLPGTRIHSAFSALLTAPDPAAFLDSYPYAVGPVTDNQPFFFYTVQPRDLWTFWTSASRESADFKINRAVPLLFSLLGVSLAATILILILPSLVLGSTIPRQPETRLSLLYFLFIGMAFILVEIALIQRFVLFLGHPTYALTVIVFSLLVASGAGSYFSARANDQVPILAAAGVAMLTFAAPWITAQGVEWPLAVRCLAAVAMIAPVGFLMGMPFPRGLRRLEQQNPAAVRWAWSLNAAASVFGSALAIFLAIYLGLRATLLIGAFCYLAAFAASRVFKPKSGAVPAPALR